MPVEYLPIEELLLDPENPRLPDSLQGATQQKMLEYLARTTSIEELMSVISENGFFGGEALIACPGNKTGEYIVIEGNRRLTAVKLLHRPEHYKKRRQIKELADSAKHKPDRLPVVVYKNRTDVLNYLGYRHITGVKQWDSLVKARYMKQLFDSTSSTALPSDRYRETAKRIGSRTDYIKRNLNSLAAFNLLEQNDFFGIDGLNDETIGLSLLTTALAYEEIADYAGTDSDPIVNSNAMNQKNIEFLAKWIFQERQDGSTVLGDSRNIKKLAKVISSGGEALAAIKNGSSLDYAYRLSPTGIKEDLDGYLYGAKEHLEKANSIAPDIKPDEPSLKIASNVAKLARNIFLILKTSEKEDEFDI